MRVCDSTATRNRSRRREPSCSLRSFAIQCVVEVWAEVAATGLLVPIFANASACWYHCCFSISLPLTSSNTSLHGRAASDVKTLQKMVLCSPVHGAEMPVIITECEIRASQVPLDALAELGFICHHEHITIDAKMRTLRRHLFVFIARKHGARREVLRNSIRVPALDIQSI